MKKDRTDIYQKYKQVSSDFTNIQPMMKRRSITLILLLTVLLSIILPLIFKDKNESINSTINVIATIISSLSTLITLVIAIILYNKFGIETPLLEKNTSIVFEFIEELKVSYLNLSGENYYMRILMHDPFQIILQSPFPESWYYERKIIFSTEYNNGLSKLFEIANSPFMPKKISEKVAKLNCYALMLDMNDYELSKYDIISVPGESQIEVRYGKFNGKDMNLFEHLNLIEDVKAEAVNWISKNSKYSPDLNI